MIASFRITPKDPLVDAYTVDVPMSAKAACRLAQFAAILTQKAKAGPTLDEFVAANDIALTSFGLVTP